MSRDFLTHPECCLPYLLYVYFIYHWHWIGYRTKLVFLKIISKCSHLKSTCKLRNVIICSVIFIQNYVGLKTYQLGIAYVFFSKSCKFCLNILIIKKTVCWWMKIIQIHTLFCLLSVNRTENKICLETLLWRCKFVKMG